MRTLLKGKAAEIFYKASTNTLGAEHNDDKYTGFGNDYNGIGGYYLSEIPGRWIAYDFCSGDEVFIEEFDELDEAIKYASGIEARPMGWTDTI